MEIIALGLLATGVVTLFGFFVMGCITVLSKTKNKIKTIKNSKN